MTVTELIEELKFIEEMNLGNFEVIAGTASGEFKDLEEITFSTSKMTGKYVRLAFFKIKE